MGTNYTGNFNELLNSIDESTSSGFGTARQVYEWFIDGKHQIRLCQDKHSVSDRLPIFCGNIFH